jgi:hypothetical protein
MDLLVEEVKVWNTPLIGAYMLWQFTRGFCENHPSGDAPVGLMHFLANAILTSQNLTERISNQRADLQSYIRSFEDKKESDLLLAIHERVKEKRQYTLESIDVAVSEGLLVWDLETAKLYPKDLPKRPSRGKNIKPTLSRNGVKAHSLGSWFAQHDLPSITTYLKVVL